MNLRLIPLMVAAALMTGTVHAADTPKAEAAKRAELEQARAELARSARRVAELSRELGGDERRIVLERSLAGPPRAGVGIVMGPSDGEAGVRIAGTTPGGPAAKAGLVTGDLLRSVDGKVIAGTGPAGLEQARQLLAGLKLGQILPLGYVRAGKPATASVKVDSVEFAMLMNPAEAPHARRIVMSTDHPIHVDRDGVVTMEETRMRVLPHDGMTMIAPSVQYEIERIGTAPCPPGSDDCGMTTLTQAFRWNGLNLASMDAKLGRYFGTSTGVLVISGGPGLAQLEPGDVIQRIDGQPVATPRDAMRALRAQDTGGQVKLDVIRERKPRSVSVTVPEAPPMRWFAPPAPPAPPSPPMPPRTPRAAPPPPPTGHAAPALPAPPAPPANATLALGDGAVGQIVSRQRSVAADGSEVIIIKTRAPVAR